jgi:hypothetical protein
MKEIEIDVLVLIERYATDLLKWDILTLFGRQPELSLLAHEVAQRIGRSSQSIRAELGDLALLGILEQSRNDSNQVLYQLTPQPRLRQAAIKFAEQG